MASGYELEVKQLSASGLKNVNWRHGKNRPYAVVWVDPRESFKHTLKVDQNGNSEAKWDNIDAFIALPREPIEDLTFYIDIMHSGFEYDTKRLIGSAQLNLAQVINDVGIGKLVSRTLTLKRPSGRPQGEVDVKLAIRECAQGMLPQPRDYNLYPYGTALQDYQEKMESSERGGKGKGLAVDAVGGALGGTVPVEKDKVDDDVAEKVVNDEIGDAGYYIWM